MRASRFFASTGARLALLQAALLITVFTVAGSLTKLSVTLIYRHELRARIQGEVDALAALDRDGGMAAVVAKVSQDARRPGGLAYRVTDKAGKALAGDLPATGAAPGWAYLDWDDKAEPGRPFEDLLVNTSTLPDGGGLTVGQDLAEESALRHALKRTLFWCGATGAALGLAMSYLFARGALRRVDGVVVAARAVSRGQMQVRAPARAAIAPDDIDELGAAFNAMLDEISALIQRVRWVSTDIAHDLRTPLTRVRHKLEGIKRSADPAAAAAAAGIETDVDELLRAFDAMLSLAEIESDPGAARRAPFDLAEAAGRVADAYRPDIEASGRHLRLSLAPAWIEGEADLIVRAVSNLVENALRHTPAGATVRLEVAADAAAARLGVIDDGPGVPEDQREAALQRFHRLDASRGAPGSGLGLAIVMAIVRRNGGTLALSDAGPGLRVDLTFPPAGVP